MFLKKQNKKQTRMISKTWICKKYFCSRLRWILKTSLIGSSSERATLEFNVHSERKGRHFEGHRLKHANRFIEVMLNSSSHYWNQSEGLLRQQTLNQWGHVPAFRSVNELFQCVGDSNKPHAAIGSKTSVTVIRRIIKERCEITFWLAKGVTPGSLSV